MKKILLSAIGVGLLSLASCSSEEAPKPNPTEGKQVLTIRVDDATRRVLENGQAANSVEKVVVYVYHKHSNGNVELAASKVIDYNSATNDAIEWNLSDEGKAIVNDASGNDKIIVKAFGLEDLGDYYFGKQLSDVIYDGEMTDPFLSNGVLDAYPSITVPKDNSSIAEVFGGELEFDASQGFNRTIELTRLVAGAYVFVKNIPYIDGMESAQSVTLDLVAEKALNNSLVLGKFDETLVVNGFNYTDETWAKAFDEKIISIDLKEWFNSFSGTENGILDTNNYKNEKTNKWYPGEVFGSAFLAPMLRGSVATLQLQLNIDGETAISWNLKMDPSSLQPSSYSTFLHEFDGTQWNQRNPQEFETSFNILRNHLYTLGEIDPETGYYPAELFYYTPSQKLTLNIKDNWTSLVTTVDKKSEI